MALVSFWSRWRRKAWRFLSLLLGAALLAGAIGWMSGAFAKKTRPGVVAYERPTAAGRTLTPVEAVKTPESIEAVGTVQPRQKIDVSSQILASIRDVKVGAGDRVEIGQLLAVLDDREVKTQLREVEAAAVGAHAELDVRARDLKRYEQMIQKNAVSRQDFDHVDAAYKAAQAQLARIDEQVARIQVMTTYTEIKAQAAGIVGVRHVDPGDLAVPGKPLLTLYDPKERELHASVPESLASAVKLNMELPVRIDAVNRSCHGVVREIVPQAQATSR
jgi:membrane fusion protein, multidrug efflux system